jgi:hypothetical protein
VIGDELMPSRNEQLPATPPAGAEPRNWVAAPHKRGKDFEPLVVSPKEAGKLLNKGHQKIYDLIGSGELESYIDADGRARNITMASIKGYIARRLEMTKRGEGLTSPTAAANAARAFKQRHAANGRQNAHRTERTESPTK